ncbi:pentatricopeptide repeat-containing protein At5g48910 isoform X2 [Dendrobium catenatum]|uniref:pentatricopeptide repeat-containing protein At5g48910 isoform X2 n=1 Tax=Dendrobium catenatum TaxID=906689 RepID=UPI0009F17C4F|nr:pentatricopeptide repeat-containing protein At5g48910 isoform X2 [Dendrobium catenatum]
MLLLASSPTLTLPSHSSSCSSSSSSTLLDLRNCKSFSYFRQLHAIAIKTGQITEPLVAAEVLRFAAISSGRDLSYALQIFDEMPEPNIFSWNTIIRAFSESDESPLQAVHIYIRLLHNDLPKPNRYSYPSLFKACARNSAIEEGTQIHCHVMKLGFFKDGFVLTNLARLYTLSGKMEDARKLVKRSFLQPGSEANAVLHNILIDGYCRLGMISNARKLFDEMNYKSVISWNGMISRYTEVGLFKEAVDVFYVMQVDGVSPNYVTLVGVLPAISKLGALGLGKLVHSYAAKNEIEVDDVLGSALVDMYGKCGSIEDAIHLFEALPKENPVTWSALIGGLSLHGQVQDAIHYFHMMEQAGVIPSDVVFLGVLNACSHAGLVDEGLLEEAEELVNNMSMKPDDVIYKALLSACRIHGKSEVGVRAAKNLLQLAPAAGDCHVLLSNFYASLGDWEAVAEVRLRMKKLDIRKNPGCSWIAVDGRINEFFVEDYSHPRIREIHLMLEEMAGKLKEEGYVSDTTGVLLKIVDEEEKDSMVLYHSEKIAVAFGLISTKPGMPLRVIKNLRVCGDCHEFLKQVSKLYGRRIIVRDRSRFHHFENGCCSCKDYW